MEIDEATTERLLDSPAPAIPSQAREPTEKVSKKAKEKPTAEAAQKPFSPIPKTRRRGKCPRPAAAIAQLCSVEGCGFGLSKAHAFAMHIPMIFDERQYVTQQITTRRITAFSS